MPQQKHTFSRHVCVIIYHVNLHIAKTIITKLSYTVYSNFFFLDLFINSSDCGSKIGRECCLILNLNVLLALKPSKAHFSLF